MDADTKAMIDSQARQNAVSLAMQRAVENASLDDILADATAVYLFLTAGNGDVSMVSKEIRTKARAKVAEAKNAAEQPQ